ncbi:MAG: DNA translocase FtsK [Pirellulales bacterium]
MPDLRRLKIDLFALALGACALFVVVALATYNATDPPSQLIYPPSDAVHNACGRTGAWLAHLLISALGIGAYYSGGSLVVVTGLLLARREVDQPMLRIIGWAISLLAVTTLAAMVFPGWTPGPVIGAGGYLGAMGRSWLEGNFAATGAYIFAFSLLAAGLLLASDYFFFRLAARTSKASGKGLLQVGQLAARRALPRRTDLEPFDRGSAAEEEEWEEDEEDEEPSVAAEIRIRTPTAKASEIEAEKITPEPDAADNGKPTATGKIKQKLKSALSGKKEKPAEAPKPKSEREEIIDQLDAADTHTEPAFDYELPPLELLLPADNVSYEEHEKEVRRKAKILEKTFLDFGFNVKVVEIETGPVIAQYEVELEAGLRLSRITGLADDLAIALRVPSVRIVAPIPGKNTVGIEVPNEQRQLVRLREVIEETNGRAKRMKIPIFLGKDVAGNPLVVDLASLPHLLIAGRTGTGKSVCLNSIIVSILMARGPDEVRMLMIDPKMVELSGYRKLPHLMHPVVTDMRKAEAILAWAVDKMEERYALLARAGVRHISVYNQLSEEELRSRVQPEAEEEWQQIPRSLPFIVIVADEIADLMMTAGKDVEQHIIRLAQKSRAVGIHLILATQKPTVDVITGLIKSNLPARIAFQVASRTDSRVVLDEMGADKLLGNGDMLFLSPGTSVLLRGQGTYLSDDEITRVVDYVGTDDQQFAHELMQLKSKDDQEAAGPGNFKSRDELYEAAIDMIVRERRGSCSLLQRALGIGYGRAARLIDFMAEDGFVGQYNGSQAREVLLSVEDWEAMTAGGAAKDDSPVAKAPTMPPSRPAKIRPSAETDPPEDAEDDSDETDERESEEDEEVEWDEEDGGDEWEEEDESADEQMEEWDEEEDEDAQSRAESA